MMDMVRGKYGLESWLALLFFLVLVVYAFAIPLYLLPSHFPRSYNEGWNAYHAMAAMSGGVLYPSADSMLANNYPPLSFYIVGIVGKIAGDYVVAGRLVSVISLGIVTYNVSRLCQWLGASRSLAAVGAMVFLLEIATFSPTYVAMNDPQFLALAFVTTAAVIFVNARAPQVGSRMLLAATLVIAGGLVKHNVVSLPLAFCTWAAVYDRKRLYIFLAWLFAIGSVVLALLYGLWGRTLVDSVLLHARVTTMRRAVKISLGLLPKLAPLMALTIGSCIWLRGSQQSLFVLAYFLWAGVTGFLMLCGDGVILNIIFDFLIAITIGSVALVFALEKKEGRSEYSPVLRNGALLILTLSVLGFYFSESKQQHFLSKSTEALDKAEEWSAVVDQLAQTEGPVACEMLSICYWAHKPPEVDFFNYSQKIKTGRISDSAFRDKLHSHYYRLILIELLFKNPTTRLPRDTEEQLFLNYQPVELVADGSGMLLAPLPRSLDTLDSAENAISP